MDYNLKRIVIKLPIIIFHDFCLPVSRGFITFTGIIYAGFFRARTSDMKTEILDTSDLVAQKAASIIAEEARKAVALRGLFIMAVSGGKTPWKMLQALTDEDVPWEGIHILQVDERIAPEGHADRNLTHLRESLSGNAAVLPWRIHAMPVEAKNPEEAAASYARTISSIAGSPAIIDLVHLGLGPDGHTASLIPGDPVLDVTDRDVATTGIYLGRKRLTLTYPIINRARMILWLITGSEKNEMLQLLLENDISIPASRISREHALILADKDAINKRVS
jgi:6-phosphogluconolactonase